MRGPGVVGRGGAELECVEFAEGGDTEGEVSERHGRTSAELVRKRTVPNYIFPFQPIQFFSVTNIAQFQYLMYRPLFWFGTGSQPTLNESLSIGNSPKYSGGNTVVSVSLKNYKWSNGESVTAQDVVFWMNVLKVEKLNWAAYSHGTPPDDVKSVTTSGNTS